MPSSLCHAIWRNDLEAAEEALLVPDNVNAADGESGWSGLHHAFYWGHMRMAARILRTGASLHVTDSKGRTPVDLLSAELRTAVQDATCPEVFAWGNGASYQLGTGGTGLTTTPLRLDDLRRCSVTGIAAAKFHSAAVTADGRLLTWGWGRGGRLGHGEFDVRSGEVATIAPRLVASLARHVVVAVSLAKHHSACVTAVGEVWTWGSNRHCQLGYSVDSQPTPRKVTTFRGTCVAAVAAANKHTVAVTDDGAVFTWGDNSAGQLGYGTCESAANGIPRIVEAMKGRRVSAVATAKRHVVAMTSEGDLWTWGHCQVSPRRIQLAGSRDVLRSDGSELVFHRGQAQVSRPVAASIAAGAAHSSCITADGVLLTWRSSDPELQPQEVGGPLIGRTIVSVSAGKYRTAAVTAEGDVFMFEGWSKPTEAAYAAATGRGRSFSTASSGASPSVEPSSRAAPVLGSSPGSTANMQQQRNRNRAAQLVQKVVPVCVDGLKRVAVAAVGEKHSLALQAWSNEPLASWPFDDQLVGGGDVTGSASTECLGATTRGWGNAPSSSPKRAFPRDVALGVASLQRICEREVALTVVEPRTVCEVLQYADAADAAELRRHCLAVIVANLDCVVLEARSSLECLPDHLLADLEQLMMQRHTMTADSAGSPGLSNTLNKRPTAHAGSGGIAGGASCPEAATTGALLRRERSFMSDICASEDTAIARQIRILRKKLQQIDALEARSRSGGAALDAQQAAKVSTRAAVTATLEALLSGASLAEAQALLPVPSAAAHESAAGLKPSRERRSARASRSTSSPSTAEEPVPLVINAPPSSTQQQQEEEEQQPDSRVHGQQAEDELSASRRVAEQDGLLDRPPVSHLTAALTAESTGRVQHCSVSDEPRSRQHLSSRQLSPGNDIPSTSGFAVQPVAAATDVQTPQSVAKTRGSKSGRKGGLSMFLRGDLERASPDPFVPQPLPKPFAWGKPAAGFPDDTDADALSPQPSEAAAGAAAKPSAIMAMRNRRASSNSGQTVSANRPTAPDAPQQQPDSRRISIPLADFMPSRSRSVPSRAGQAAPVAEAAAWGGIGASPPAAEAPSLREIQESQWNHRETLTACRSNTPGSSPPVAGATQWQIPRQASLGTSPGVKFPTGTSPSSFSRRMPQQVGAPHSRWYIAEEHAVTPLREIERQETEAAALAAAEALQQQQAAEAAAAKRKAARAKRRQDAKLRAAAAASAADASSSSEQLFQQQHVHGQPSPSPTSRTPRRRSRTTAGQANGSRAEATATASPNTQHSTSKPSKQERKFSTSAATHSTNSSGSCPSGSVADDREHREAGGRGQARQAVDAVISQTPKHRKSSLAANSTGARGARGGNNRRQRQPDHRLPSPGHERPQGARCSRPQPDDTGIGKGGGNSSQEAALAQFAHKSRVKHPRQNPVQLVVQSDSRPARSIDPVRTNTTEARSTTPTASSTQSTQMPMPHTAAASEQPLQVQGEDG